MAGKIKHVLAILLRMSFLALLCGGIMACGVWLLLRGNWRTGLALIIVAAMLLAMPLSLYLTPILCNILYGPSEVMKASDSMHDAHIYPKPTVTCSACHAARAWILALFQGVYVPPCEVMSMRSRGTPPDIIINAYVMTCKSDTIASIAVLEDLYITEHSRIHNAFDLVHMVTGIID
jgi:hypothetical protein